MQNASSPPPFKYNVWSRSSDILSTEPEHEQTICTGAGWRYAREEREVPDIFIRTDRRTLDAKLIHSMFRNRRTFVSNVVS